MSAILYDQSCNDIDSFERDVEIRSRRNPRGPVGLDECEDHDQKQQLIETQFTVKNQQLSELDNQAERLKQVVP